MKVLIIRLSSIGDIVLTTPICRCIKKQLPGTEIHYLVKNNFKSIVQSNPYIYKVHVLHNDLAQVTSDLERENFDYIIDLHHNLRTLTIKRALKRVKAFSFKKLNVHKWFFTALKINRMPDVHIVDRYFATIKHFGVINDGAGLDFFIPKSEQVADHDIPAAQSLGFIGIVIGAAHNTKKLPLHKLVEICEKIDYPIILLGGPEDKENGEKICSIDPVKIYNSCGKFSLNESADLVRRARLIITHDTGLMHIAAAFKKRIISVWGNTVPAFGMTPYSGHSIQANAIMEVNNLWCRPCSKIGYAKCPLGHFKCMNKQDVLVIAGLTKDMLNNGIGMPVS